MQPHTLAYLHQLKADPNHFNHHRRLAYTFLMDEIMKPPTKRDLIQLFTNSYWFNQSPLKDHENAYQLTLLAFDQAKTMARNVFSHLQLSQKETEEKVTAFLLDEKIKEIQSDFNQTNYFVNSALIKLS